SAESIRGWAHDGTIRVLGELGFQYQGALPTEEAPDAYFALAEDLDIPVGVHVGPGAPGAPYVGYPKYEMRLTNPLLYENALTRHPKLRLYIMHAAWPMLDQIVGLLYAHPRCTSTSRCSIGTCRARSSTFFCGGSWTPGSRSGSCSDRIRRS